MLHTYHSRKSPPTQLYAAPEESVPCTDANEPPFPGFGSFRG